MIKTIGCEHNKKKQCRICAKRRSRKKHAMRYAYQTLKDNVKRRKGIGFFELTFEEFSQYAIETEYLGKKGVTKIGYHIDRIDDTMGYFIGNIQPLTNVLNLAKRYKKLNYLWDDTEGKMVAFVTKHEEEHDENKPF
jgi:hypothetical protein